MAIELSNITFTDQDDIFPVSEVHQIINSGVANTFIGNDTIMGIGSLDINDPSSNYGIANYGTLVTAEGNDAIIGTSALSGLMSFSTFNTGEGNDIVAGEGDSYGIITSDLFNTAEGDDVITGESNYCGISINDGIFNTGDGNDKITGIIIDNDPLDIIGMGIVNNALGFNTGDGNDTIDGSGFYGVINDGLINTGNGKDIIIAKGMKDEGGYGLLNRSTINTGEDDDIITGIGGIYNEGVINMGGGNDSIMANASFESDSNSNGNMFLGKGEDYVKGFGSGNFYGDNGNDILELTPGSYSVEVLGSAVNFIDSNNITMKTFEFENLIVNNTTYNFASLSNGQTISVVLL
jgi:hypothetical protein